MWLARSLERGCSDRICPLFEFFQFGMIKSLLFAIGLTNALGEHGKINEGSEWLGRATAFFRSIGINVQHIPENHLDVSSTVVMAG